MSEVAQTCCEEPTCVRELFVDNICRYHYSTQVKEGVRPRTRMAADRCDVRECRRDSKSLRLCSMHYQQFLRGGSDPDFTFDSHRGIIPQRDRVCYFSTCDRRGYAKGLCQTHYTQQLYTGKLTDVNRSNPCPVGSCGKPGGARIQLCLRHAYYQRQYGLSVQQVVELWSDPRCGNPGCARTESLHVDHDHKCCAGARSCGRCVRGWLCAGCNRALGILQENPARMQGLLAYWESYAASRR